MKKTNNFFAFWALILIGISILHSSSVNAIPVPMGIDGTIYDLDGMVQVRSGIDFSVTNANNGQTASGKTGHGSSGRYSVSLNGNLGDAITVSAWNKYNNINATMQLLGVMRNVNLFLNMTYPPYAPNITSIPDNDDGSLLILKSN